MAELKFEIAPKSRNIVKNGYFENAYSFQAADWEVVNHDTGTSGNGLTPPQGARILFLSDKYPLSTESAVATDAQYRRGATAHDSIIVAQAGSGIPGFWLRQNDLMTIGTTYTVRFRVRWIYDESLAFGLPPGSGFIQVRAGSTGTVTNVVSAGDYTASLTCAGNESLYIVFYACRGTVEYIEVDDPQISTTPIEVPNPNGWRDIVEVIEPDDLLGGVFRRFVQGVVFHGEGYNVIKEHFDRVGPSAAFTCDVYSRKNQMDPWAAEFNGTIYMDDSIWDLSRCTVECVLEMADSFGLLMRNMESEFSFYDSSDVSGQFIGQPARVNAAGTGVTINGTTDYAAWYVHDIVEFAVKFATNGQLGLDAPDLGGSAQGYPSDGVFSQMCLTSGNELRKNQGQPAYTTVYELFEALRTCFGLYAKIVGADVVIGRLDDLYGLSTAGPTFSNIPDLKRANYDDIRFKTLTIGYRTANTDASLDPHGAITIRYPEANSSGATESLETNYIASTHLINTKLGESSASGSIFEYDRDVFFLELQAHTTYVTKAIPAVPGYNVPGGTNCNETIFPWVSLGYHSKNIYASGALAKIKGNIAAGLLNFGHYLDFKNSNPLGVGNYTTWLKGREGLSTERYLKWLYQFEYPIDCADRDDLVENFENYANLSGSESGYEKAWIKRIERQFSTGLAKIEMVGE